MAHEVPWRFIKGLSSKKEREKAGMTVAEGPPSVFSALESGVQVEYLVMSESFSNSPGGLSVGRIVEVGQETA